MRLEQLEFFVQAAKSKSMRAAADKLHASPQNISKSIKQLEDELSCALFIRSRQGLLLTPRGQEVYDAAIAILDKVTALTQLGQNAAAGQNAFRGSLRIATSASLSLFIALLISDISEQYPHLTISFTERERLDVQKLITAQPYDIFFVSGTPALLEAYQAPPMRQVYRIYLLKAENLQLIMSKSSDLCARKVIPLKMLATLPMVAYAPTDDPIPLAQEILKPYRLQLKQSLLVNNLSLSLQYICDRKYYNLSCPMYYNYLPANYQNALLARPLSVKIPWQHLMFLPKSAISDASRIFLQTLKHHFPDTLKML